MKTVQLSRRDYLAKVSEIATAKAYKHATEWCVSPERVGEFVKIESQSMIDGATPKRGAWSIIDLDGTIYETAHAYIPYAPMY